MSIESLPCIVCGRRLQRVDDTSEGQPWEGVVIETHGNYGSTVFDPMNGNYLLMNLCDECLVRSGEQGRVLASRDSMPVQTSTVCYQGTENERILRTIVGSYRIDRPYVNWTKEIPTDDEMMHVGVDEILSTWFDDPTFRWNLDRHHFEAMRDELNRYDEERGNV